MSESSASTRRNLWNVLPHFRPHESPTMNMAEFTSSPVLFMRPGDGLSLFAFEYNRFKTVSPHPPNIGTFLTAPPPPPHPPLRTMHVCALLHMNPSECNPCMILWGRSRGAQKENSADAVSIPRTDTEYKREATAGCEVE